MGTLPGSKKIKYLAIGVGACLMVGMAITGASEPQDELAAVRAATARFHRVEVAQQEGYDLMPPLDGCLERPGVGAMGYHYFNSDLIDDVSPPDPTQPEAMVYAPGPNGKLKLASVEWVVPSEPWHAAGNIAPPRVLGHEMHILNPALGWYIHHAWVWKHNPAGMHEDWNPEVICR